MKTWGKAEGEARIRGPGLVSQAVQLRNSETLNPEASVPDWEGAQGIGTPFEKAPGFSFPGTETKITSQRRASWRKRAQQKVLNIWLHLTHSHTSTYRIETDCTHKSTLKKRKGSLENEAFLKRTVIFFFFFKNAFVRTFPEEPNINGP